jgi:hypothetical protein
MAEEHSPVIRLNIRHFHELLKLHCPVEIRVQVMELLAEAQSQLHVFAAEPRSCPASGQDGGLGDVATLRDKARQCFRLAHSVTNRDDVEALEELGREMEAKASAIDL